MQHLRHYCQYFCDHADAQAEVEVGGGEWTGGVADVGLVE